MEETMTSGGSSRARSRARIGIGCLGALMLAPAVAGCGASPWEPGVPRGATYEYDYQGFRASGATVVTGSGPGGGYGVAFGFRDAREVHPEEGAKDPFAQSATLDGLHFNAHLERQGVGLQPQSGLKPPSSGDGVSREGGSR
jgi:hypothetical protein